MLWEAARANFNKQIATFLFQCNHSTELLLGFYFPWGSAKTKEAISKILLLKCLGHLTSSLSKQVLL